MDVQAQKSRLAGRIWQSMAQSGVDVSRIPRDQLEKMVDGIADAMLVEFDQMLGEAAPPQSPDSRLDASAPATADRVEKVLWEGRPFLSLVERYVVTSERVRIITGLIGKGHEDIELIRVKDVDHTQGMGERMLNIGDVVLHSADPSRPIAVLRNVTDPDRVHEIVRRAMIDARKEYPFRFEQEL